MVGSVPVKGPTCLFVGKIKYTQFKSKNNSSHLHLYTLCITICEKPTNSLQLL